MKISSKQTKWIGAALAGFAVLAAFASVLQGEFLHWDDRSLFVENLEGSSNALQLRADLYVRTGRPVLAESDCLRLLALPDPANTHHEKALMILSVIKKIPEE